MGAESTEQQSEPLTRLPWDQRQAPSLANSALLAVIGGFLDGFTYVGHGHVFANAMTGNVVLLGIYAVAQSWHQSFRHLPPILTFILGVCVARAILLPRARKRLPYPYLSVLAAELFILAMVALLPDDTRDFWITTSIAFAASMQVETFRVVNGRSYNSTFTTGNLRSFSEGVFDWIFCHNPHEARAQAADFGVICIAFFVGATSGGLSTGYLGNRALWIDFVLLLVLFIRLFPGRRVRQNEIRSGSGLGAS
jgi:uncharacterized membrane protein YoaK (UPF0700 family)